MNFDGDTPSMSYEFRGVDHCNMCNSPVGNSIVLGKRLNRSQGVRPTRKVGITTTIMKCKSCGLVYSNPLPVPKNMSQHYGMPPESYWSPNYFVVDDAYFSGHIKKFLEKRAVHDGSLRALDIGAGVGKCMKALDRHGFEAYGLEPSEPFYRRAIETMGIPGDRISHASVEEAQYPESMFDFITFGAVLEHLYDPSAAILKALGWAKPGGLIHIEVPSSRWLTNKIANMIYALQGLDYVANISPMHVPFHLYEFGAKSFLLHAKKNAYSVASLDILETRTYLPGVLDSLARPLMRATKSGMQMEVWLRKSALQ
jgi:2-polyprenyl-3-methyl-5-hydroxy-6-metoxy-1,4-benzoquinol methylase